MQTATKRLDSYAKFDRDYRDKRAVEIDDKDADSPPCKDGCKCRLCEDWIDLAYLDRVSRGAA